MKKFLLVIALAVAGCEQTHRAKVFSAAEGTVRPLLLAPSTAKFCSMDEAKFVEKDGNQVVTFWVDAQNAFGVPIRRHFEVSVDPKTYQVKSAVCLEEVEAAKARETDREIARIQRETEEIKRLTDETVRRMRRP
ncbi:MAG: hypothetical protein DLM73_10470 [Chthoniobacterales bacterium]|nr:MAG: hypothetical protein DLM73_10470 [Chthoniobacterales bacterium]